MAWAGKVFKWWWLAALVSLAAAFILPCVGMSDSQIIDLKIDKVFSELDAYAAALDQYRQKRGDFPADNEGLEAMRGVSLTRVSKDAWGSSFVYKRNAPNYPIVYSIGIDRVDSDGAGDDVTTRDKRYRCEDYAINCAPSASDIAAYGVLFLLPLSLITGIVRGIMRFVRRRSTSPTN